MGLSIQDAIKKAGPLLALAIPAQKELDDRNEDIVKICDTVKESLDDGFQWDDLLVFFTDVVPELIEMMDEVSHLKGLEKRGFCTGALTTVYFVIDPDIKKLPEFIERRVEAWAVPKLAAMAVDAAFKMRDRMQKKSEEASKDSNPETETPASE
jgi:hypothetical protein